MAKFTHKLLAAILTCIQPPVPTESVCLLPACLFVCVIAFFLSIGCQAILCVCVDVFVCVLGCTRERKIVTKRGDRKVLEQNNKIISVLQEWTFDGVLFA